MLADKLCMHKSCRQIVDIAHHGQDIEITLFPRKIIERTLCEMVVKTLRMFGFVKIKIPRKFLVLGVFLEPL